MERKRTKYLDCTKIGVSHEGPHNVMSITPGYIKYYKSHRKKKNYTAIYGWSSYPSPSTLIYLVTTFHLYFPSKSGSRQEINLIYSGHTIVKIMVRDPFILIVIYCKYTSCSTCVDVLVRETTGEDEPIAPESRVLRL